MRLWWYKLPLFFLFVLVVLLTIRQLVPTLPQPIKRITRPFRTYLKVHEAEELLKEDENPHVKQVPELANASTSRVGALRNYALAALGLLQTLVWVSAAAYDIASPSWRPKRWPSALPWPLLILAVSWFYATLKPALKPRNKPHYDLFALYIIFAAQALIHLGFIAILFYVEEIDLSRGAFTKARIILNLIVIATCLWITLTTNMAEPGVGGPISRADIGTKISPEDYTTLWKWLTFAWVTPVTQQTSLSHEDDVWELSPLMRTRALYTKYTEVGKQFYSADGKVTPSSFFWHWWACNSLDVILEFVLSMMSLLLEFSGPLFLKLILDCIAKLSTTTDPKISRGLRAQAFIYAVLALICSLSKTATDLHHLWYGRRAANRTRNEIMMRIYEKALRRREVMAPPVISSDSKEDDGKAASEMPASAQAAEQTDDEATKKKQEAEKKKAVAESADLGKIVNLMSTDTAAIERMIYTCFWFYGAPVTLVICVFWLYKLLGWSAFAGIGVFIIIAPLNHVLSGRAVKIYADMQTARDKKMSVLNEMVSEIKFIKFLADEERWLKRAMDVRAEELKVIRKSGVLDIMMSFVWHACPIGVSILSFWAYVWSGHRLTVSTAFTAVQLFAMLANPLGVLPMVLVQYFRIRVSINRITTFLSEPEVDDVVSSFKNESSSSRREGTDETLVEESQLGILNGFFYWSKPETSETMKKEEKKKPWYKRKFWARAAIVEPVPEAEVANAAEPVVPPVAVVQEGLDASTLASGAATPATVPDTAERRFELRDINVIFPPGQLSLVTGPTASGKTALLRALLGEMYTVPPTSDTYASTQLFLPKHPTTLDPTTGLRDYISYAAQTPWLEHLTIKENILFGSEYDEKRYRQVIECCSLKPDLDALEDGDETEIGERGVSLSGGQKARVALARAVYAPTRHVLLDDPLSAVDSHTARFLFERLLQGPLMANRTVVLVTHHVELVLPATEYLIRMLDGRIDTQGSISELRKRGLLQEIAAKAKKEEKKAEATNDSQEEDDTKKDKSGKPAKKLIEEEKRAEGRTGLNVYMSYIQASAYITWIGLLLFITLETSMTIGEKAWMQVWGEAYGKPRLTLTAFFLNSGRRRTSMFPVSDFVTDQFSISASLPSADERPLFYVGVFAAIGFASIILEMCASTILVLGAYRASRILFQRLLEGITRATMRWHDTTPTGRILNRMSKDFETIDTTIATSFSYTITSFSMVILSVLTIVVISPFFLIPGALIALAYLSITKVYLRVTRPLKRLDSTTISPIYASFRTTLEGLSTIRAFSAERRFLDIMIRKLDVTTKCYYTYWMMNRWALCRFDTLGGITTFVVMVLVAIFGGNTQTQTINVLGIDLTTFKGKTVASSGFEGLLIVSAMGFTMYIYWACRFISQLELDLNSVERINEYLSVPQEPPSIIEGARPPAYWPSSGDSSKDLITVQDLVIKYAPDLPSVLSGVSFTVKGRERVGLVGRTGSGKSTLATALLRFVEPTSGRIIIDGIDTSSIGLYDLRSRVTFIQQDSVLFSGTIRDNLDPFNEHTDVECLDVLHRVNLIDATRTPSRPASVINGGSDQQSPPSPTSTTTGTEAAERTAAIKLDTIVNSSGSNFSHGQRQLIALARALLRKTSVIIMDEATSSIDFETDNKIQAALREEFSSSCVITIAHRLQTIIDYDRIIVMDAGRIVENGSPRELLTDPNGAFYSMCAKAGIVEDL